MQFARCVKTVLVVVCRQPRHYDSIRMILCVRAQCGRMHSAEHLRVCCACVLHSSSAQQRHGVCMLPCRRPISVKSLYVSMYKAGPQVSFCTRDQELKVMQVSPLPIPEAVAVLTTIQPDLCAAAQGVVCVHAVCSGNSTMLPKLFHPDRVSSLAALFGGILANGVSTVGHGACPSAKFIVSLKRHSPMSFVRGDLRRRKDLCPCCCGNSSCCKMRHYCCELLPMWRG